VNDRVRSHRALWIGLTAAAVALVLLVSFAGWTLHPAGLKPRLIEAAQRATGRTLTVSGKVGITLALVPTVSMEDVTLANPPGFSRPEMVKVARVELGLALLPLLRHRFEVEHVTLVRPDIVLETDPAGRANWLFARLAPQAQRDAPSRDAPSFGSSSAPPTSSEAAPGGASRGQASPGGTARQRFAVSFKDADVVDGRFGWIDGKSGQRHEVETPRLTLDAPKGGPVRLTGAVTFEGRTIALTARAEPTELPGAAPGTGPWPVALQLESGGATVTADGQIDHPLAGRGYTIVMDANVPDPSVFAPLFPRLPLAALKAVTAHAEVSDSGGPNPTISALQVRAGLVDLGKFAHGATLEDVTLTAKGAAPVKVSARLTMAGFDSGISGNIGDLPWLASGASGPVAVDLEWNGASARASVKGTIQTPARFAGLALDVAANVPDPSLLMDNAPPGLKSIVFRTRLTSAPGPVPFLLTSSAGDLAGELSVSRLPKPSVAQVSVEGQVWSRRLDLDMLRSGTASAEASGAAAAPAGGGTVPAVAPGGAAEPSARDNAARAVGPGGATESAAGDKAARAVGQGGAAEPAAADKAVRAAGPGGTAEPLARDKTAPMIPDTKLPFDLLRAVDGGVKFTLAHVLVAGADVRRITGTVSVKDGQLRVDPFTIAAPDQRMSGLLVADGATSPPSVHLSVDAPGLALRPLLSALGLPPVATGTVEVRADVTGAGDSPRAIAASLDGWAGVATEGGQLDARMVNAWLGQLRPLHIEGPDVTDLRCFAMRADAKDGIVTIQPVALNTAGLIVDGGGDVDLRHETLALRLRPRTKIGGTGIALPVRVNGPMRAPSAKIDLSAAGPGGGMLAGLVLGGKDVMGAAGGGDPCPVALARAREGAAPSGPADDAPPEASTPAPGGKQ
jgi:AsmA protein